MSVVHEQLKGSHALLDAEDSVGTQLMRPDHQAELSPMAMIRMAVSSNAGMDVINGLVKLQREEREYQAEQAFNEAMQKAQAKMRRVGVDASNPQTHSKYATYAKLDAAVRPIYTEEGFSLSFNEGDPPAPDCIRVLCYVSNKGFTRTYKKDMPADGKGAKGNDVMSKTHASAAAMSYGMRYLLKMIFNVAVGETDDDGNGGSKEMNPDNFMFWDGKISSSKNMDDLNAQYQAACDAAGMDQGAKDSFKKTANGKWREFGGGK